MKVEVVSPFPMESFPRCWGWMAGFRGRVSDDFGPKTLAEFVEEMLDSAAHGQRTWAVYGDGELGGLITFERSNSWVGTAHCVFKPDFQGKGIAPGACRTAIAEMFAEGIGKLSFYPLAGNLAIGSLLIRLGARREGCLRAQTLCGGKPTAMNVYGLLKAEFENAISSSSASDRSGSRGRDVAPRELLFGETENPDLHHDGQLVAGDEVPPGPALVLQLEPDVGPVGRHGAD